MPGLLNALRDSQYKFDLVVSGMGQEGNFVTVAWVVLAGASLFVLLNLIIHVILRGLWISAVGLRSVSGDIDFDHLKLAPRFDGFLRRKTGSFDAYIERLENLCSIVFSINGIHLNPAKSFPQQSLECMASIYEVRINDSIFSQPAFRFFEHPNAGEKGLFAVLDVQYLPRGAHQIRIRKLGRNILGPSDSLAFRDFVSFPFWKE